MRSLPDHNCTLYQTLKLFFAQSIVIESRVFKVLNHPGYLVEVVNDVCFKYEKQEALPAPTSRTDPGVPTILGVVL
jgi:hypothetical protein